MSRAPEAMIAATAKRNEQKRESVLEVIRQMECPRFRGHLIAWVCPTRRKGCGVHATHASPVPGAVPS